MKKYNELQLAKELMRFPSITPVDAGTMNFLARKLRSLGFKCKILEFKSKNSKPVKNLYARLGKSRPNFCYAGHTDVVPPGNLNDWTVNPFKPAVKGNYLIGRGANDMKASVACFVAAVSKFKSKKFKGSISLLITGDEEGIAINGTKRVVEYLKRKKEKIDFCLVGEPTNQNKLGEMMKIGRRGSITGYLTVCGIQGHVAYPHDANNPAPVMTKILNQIENIKLDKGTKNFQPSNLEIVKINTDNTADNVIPGDVTATFNIRFNDRHSSNSLKKKLNKVKKVTTMCPHCVVNLQKEYSKYHEIKYEVKHHTQVISELLDEGKININPGSLEKVTYHDPCNLSRTLGEVDAPRNAIKAAAPEFFELDESGKETLCCGAGGALWWKKDTGKGRTHLLRAEQVIESKTDTVVTGCNFCYGMLNQGIDPLTPKGQDKIKVKDVADIVAENLS